MPKTLDDMLRDVWTWREAVAKDLACLSPKERSAFWNGAVDSAGKILGHRLSLPRRNQRARRLRRSSAK